MNIVSYPAMNDKSVRIILILIIGWYIGYIHHFAVSRGAVLELERKVVALKKDRLELSAISKAIKKVSVKTTAYSNDPISIDVAEWRDGMTATGVTAMRGHVAADWRVFPPGTRIYIPGYGEAVVEDRGGAVKGNHLDLFMDTPEEAIRWGVRRVDVYVIEMGVLKAENTTG